MAMDSRSEIWWKLISLLLYYFYYTVLKVDLYPFMLCKYVILLIFIIDLY